MICYFYVIFVIFHNCHSIYICQKKINIYTYIIFSGHTFFIVIRTSCK